jgi:hypothetical protein
VRSSSTSAEQSTRPHSNQKKKKKKKNWAKDVKELTSGAELAGEARSGAIAGFGVEEGGERNDLINNVQWPGFVPTGSIDRLDSKERKGMDEKERKKEGKRVNLALIMAEPSCSKNSTRNS